MNGDVTGKYHKAIVAAVAAGLVSAISVLTGAMTPTDTFGDIPTVTWLWALSAFIVGSGITGGAVAISKKNTEDSPQQVEGGAPEDHRQSLGAPQNFPSDAGSGAAPSTEHPSARPGAAPSIPNPGGQKG